jgi:outer membrane protein
MKKNIRWSALFLAMMISVVLLAGCGTEKPSTIGIVDMQKVMAENPKIKQMQETLTTKAQELTAKLDKEKTDNPAMKPEEFQQKEQLAYAEFMKLKQEFEAQIEMQTKKVLEEVAKEKKLGAVIYKNGMAWGGIDVTDEVLKKLQ